MRAAALKLPTIDEIRLAAARLKPYIVCTPLLRLYLHDRQNPLYLKLENLQPVGSFKVRPVANALLCAEPGALQKGVYTASSGNAGVAMAWTARQLGISATVYAPDNGPTAKLDAIRALGATVSLVSEDQWWEIVLNSGHAADPGYYVDGVRNRSAMAGNGTIGLEIARQLPDVDTVVVPFGGGGIVSGIGSAIAVLKPDARVVIAESEAAAPVAAAFRRGSPVRVAVSPSFISGAGAPAVLEDMWPLISRLVRRSVTVPVAEVANAVRLLFLHNRVVAEGAGAISVAAALSETSDTGKTVCVVTGGNIDQAAFCNILNRQPV
ncbi:MAG: pyridoxal-phosphate dependent enzyme [Woeseia sp.]